MSVEVCNDAKFRVVRNQEAGHYYLQVGFGDHYRTFNVFKLGKFDQLREQAKLDSASGTRTAFGVVSGGTDRR